MTYAVHNPRLGAPRGSLVGSLVIDRVEQRRVVGATSNHWLRGHHREREQLLEAADVLLFGEPDSERTVRWAEVLIENLETSKRWSGLCWLYASVRACVV
jgi:hypothetical protein